jgi:hypothetical protein
MRFVEHLTQPVYLRQRRPGETGQLNYVRCFTKSSATSTIMSS